MATRNANAVIESTDGTIDFNNLTGMNGNMWEGADEPQRSFEPVPAGRYNAQIVVVEGPTLNKAGDGYWIKVQYRLLDEPHANRRVFGIISLKETAKWKIQEFFRAMGKEDGDTSYTPGEFDGMFCTIDVGIREANGEYKAQNDVKKIMPIADDADVSSPWN